VPDVAVIVPVRDGASSMPTLLASLWAQDLERDRYEVIVVDNASRDGTADVAAARGARVVSEPRPNRSLARNAGAHAARADQFAFIDADCTASPGWLSALLDCHARAGVALVAGRVEIETRAAPNAIERFETHWRFDQQTGVQQGWAATANLFVTREAFEAVGGLDANYRHIGEDVDFCLRAGRAGFKLGYCDAAVVYHEAEHELSPLLRRAFFHGYSAAQARRRLGRGHIAWRNPRILLSRRGALAFYGVDSESLPPAERRRQTAIAMVTYASRVAGSIWSSMARAR
jgi:GT2 family glycosyltransferase